MDAWRDGAAGPVDGDAPEVADAEGKGLRAGDGGVVKVVVELAEVFREVRIVVAAEFREERGAEFGEVDLPQGLVIAQAFAARAVVGAEPGVGLDRGAVGVEGHHVGGDRAGMLVAGIAVDAVEDGIAVVLAEPAEVGEHEVDGDASGRADGQAFERGFVEREDAVGRGELGDHLGEIARQLARPAEGVDAVGEGCGEQGFEGIDNPEARVAGGQGEGCHAGGRELATPGQRGHLDSWRLPLRCCSFTANPPRKFKHRFAS